MKKIIVPAFLSLVFAVSSAMGDGPSDASSDELFMMAPHPRVTKLVDAIHACGQVPRVYGGGDQEAFAEAHRSFWASHALSLLKAQPEELRLVHENRYHRTALHFAMLYCPRLTGPLVEAGADLAAKDLEGMTPLHYAAISQVGFDEFKLILERSWPAALEEETSSGGNLIRTFAFFSPLKADAPLYRRKLQYALNRGLDRFLDTVDWMGLTPLDHAKRFKNQDAIELLSRAGAK